MRASRGDTGYNPQQRECRACARRLRSSMIRTAFAFLAGLLLFSSPCLAQDYSASSNTGSIHGTVIDTRTSQPIAGANVRLFSRGADGRRSTTTAADGTFLFKGLSPGKYGVNASHEGYSSGVRGMYRSGLGSWVAVGAGQTVDDVVVRLAPTGVIAGRITNEREEPMAQIFVQAMKRSSRDGQLVLISSHSSFTDENGEFRIAGLTSGTYCVKATKARATEKESPSLVYVPLFYPDATDPALAQAIDLRPGEELNGVRLTLTKVRSFHVKGRILTANGAPAKAANVTLSQFGSNGYSIDAETQGSGKFDIAGVPTGTYTLQAQWSANDQSDEVSMGSATVTVGETDLVAPDVTVYPGATIPGHLVMPEEAKGSELKVGVVSLSPFPGSGGGGGTTSVQPDGSFTFHDVAEGRYHLRLSSVPAGYFSTAGQDEVVVSHGHSGPVEIHLESGAGQIHGVIYKDEDKQIPADSAVVLLLPEGNGKLNSEELRMVNADRSGRFSLQSVPPGSYSILAFETMDRDSLTDPDAMRSYADAGQAVHVDKGSSLDLQITLTASSSNAE